MRLDRDLLQRRLAGVLRDAWDVTQRPVRGRNICEVLSGNAAKVFPPNMKSFPCATPSELICSGKG